MKHLLLTLFILIPSTALADKGDSFEDYYGLYTGYRMQRGGSIDTPPCDKKLTPDYAKFLVTQNKIEEPFSDIKGIAIAAIVEKRAGSSGHWLALIYDVTTKEPYRVYRYLWMTPYRDQYGKITKEAEIDGVVFGVDKKNQLKCWSSWGGGLMMFFDPRDKDGHDL